MKSIDENNSESSNSVIKAGTKNQLPLSYRKLLIIAKVRAKRIKELENDIIQLKSAAEKNSVSLSSDSSNSAVVSTNKKHSHFKFYSYICVILLPAFIVFLYTFLFYDSMYVSTSTFTIKSNSVEKSVEIPSGLSFLGGGDNMDLNTASAYIKSLDMFYILNHKLNLIGHYSTHDIISSISSRPTQSDIEDYWSSIIEVNIDSESALMQLHVRAFSPEYSQKLSESILNELDSFINTMNKKMTTDSINLANIEVEKAKSNIEIISEKIRKFRDQNTFIDPSSEASNLLSIISNLENLITQTKAELAQKRAYLREDSVDIISLKNKISSLEQEVSSLRSRIAMGNSTDVNSDSDRFANVLTRTLSEFEQLNLEYQFAQKVLESSLNNLENTRQLSLNKSKYLITIDKPKIPDESLWPRPLLATIVTFVITIFALSALSLLFAAIKDHLGI